MHGFEDLFSMVLFYRILIMYMFLNLANTETYPLCRIHNPYNCLALLQRQWYFRSQSCHHEYFCLSSPKAMQENHHRQDIHLLYL